MTPGRRMPFYLLVAGAYAFLTITRAAQAGMFLDGVAYASIARNLAAGHGTLWSPFYTTTLHAAFHDQPPLGFALQAGAFALFGDHLAVERVYSIVIGAIVGLLIALIWRRTTGDRDFDWMPLLFCLLPPAFTWSVVNNMLEVTQAVFTTLAVLAFVLSLSSRRWWLWAACAGLAVTAAALTKGPVGLFPLAAPVVAAAAMPDRLSNAARSGLLMLAVVAGSGGLLVVADDSGAALQAYWNQQVLASIAGERGGEGRISSMTVHFVLPILGRMSALAILALAAARALPSIRVASSPSWPLFYFLLAIAASLPIAASARIAGHYFVPAIPVFALAFSSLIVPAIRPAIAAWMARPAVRTAAAAFGSLLLCLAAAIPLAGRSLEPRDASWMPEYAELAPAMPRDATIGTCYEVGTDWGMHAYMQRFFEVSLAPGTESRHPHFLAAMDRPCEVPSVCDVVKTTARLALYRCAQR